MEGTDNHSKAHKPLIERRRRERINRSLDELKSLVLHSLNRDERDYSRMEKADILEMAVRFLRSFHQSEKLRQNSPKYTAGFNQCAANVMWYVNRSPDIAPDVRLQLLQRIATGLHRVQSNTVYDRLPEVGMVSGAVGVSQTGSEHFQRLQMGPADLHDVRGVPYDVRSQLMNQEGNPQDEVCDLSIKRSPEKNEEEYLQSEIGNYSSRTNQSPTLGDREVSNLSICSSPIKTEMEKLYSEHQGQKMGHDERSPHRERERCERHQNICEYEHSAVLNLPSQERKRHQDDKHTHSRGEQRQYFLTDSVWRPF